MLFGRKDKIRAGALTIRRSWYVSENGELKEKIEVAAGAPKPVKKASKGRRSPVPGRSSRRGL